MSSNTSTGKQPGRTGLRRWLLFGLLGLVLVGWLLLGRPLQNQITAWAVFHTPVPNAARFNAVLDQSGDPLPLLDRAWHSDEVVPRELAVIWLKDHAKRQAALIRRALPLLRAAALDADMSVRATALGALAEARNPALNSLALAQLDNVDPQIRLLGLSELRGHDLRTDVPRLMDLLDDPSLIVAATAETLLRQATGVSFGVRLRDAVPSGGLEGQTPNSAGAERVRQAILQRQRWWRTNRASYPAPRRTARSPSPPAPYPVADFTLPALDGSTVRLSDFRGKVVLLNFWATWCTACAGEIPQLKELQRRYPHRLVVLAVALDSPQDLGGGESNGPTASASALQVVRARVARFVKARGIRYRVLLDPTRKVGSLFNGGELPTNVMIDPAGRLRRRFMGPRPLTVWTAMLAELLPPAPR